MCFFCALSLRSFAKSSPIPVLPSYFFNFLEGDRIILQQGKNLEIDLNEENDAYQVRIHTSLGRLIKRFQNVKEKVIVKTNDWKVGIYIVVIKSGEFREIKRVVLTR